MSSRDSLSAVQARRLVLKSQGFGLKKTAAPGPARLQRQAENLGVLQIDSVNVLVRAHYLPLFSRLGPYRQECLDGLCWGSGGRRKFFEGWGHEASLMPVKLFPLMRWRMKKAAEGIGIYKGLAEFGRQEKRYIGQVLKEVAARGPVGAGDLSRGGGTGPWWGWSPEKTALEWLFAAGRVTVAQRRGFERLYDLTENVLPADYFNAPELTEKEAWRQLLLLAADALGVATEKDLRDYFRLAPAESKAALADLINSGELRAIEVESWKEPAYCLKSVKIPGPVKAAALLSPFDSLIWERARTERLFNFRYRLEFYTPPAKRIYGYHVLPFLKDERLVGRVDLKAERGEGFLRVISAYSEDADLSPEELAGLAENLKEMALWLNLASVRVNKKGPLEKKLAALV